MLLTAGDGCVYALDERVKAISIERPSYGNPLIQIRRLYRMRRYFKAHRDYRIVSFGTTINLFTIIASLGLGNRVIVSERNDPCRCRYKILRNLIYSFGKGFVFQTEEAKNCFSTRIRRHGIVIPNPVRSGLPHLFTGKREKKIAAVGRLEPQKNHKLLLEAFAGFHQKFPAYELHIFGIGKLEQELKEMTKEYKVEHSVVFEGFRKDILEIIRSYGMYVLSSDYEGISNSLMEAMALGLPCVSTDCPIGGSALCICHEENGLLVPVGNASALQLAMEQIAGDEELAERLGRNAQAVRARFSIEEIGRAWHDYIAGNAD